VWWYQIHVIDPSKARVPQKPILTISGKKRKRDSDPPQISSSTTPRVIICGWTPYAGTGDVIPEFWEYLPFPEERMKCLNVRQNIWDLDQDLQGIASMGGRLFLLGRDNPDVDLWDICVEVSDLVCGLPYFLKRTNFHAMRRSNRLFGVLFVVVVASCDLYLAP